MISFSYLLCMNDSLIPISDYAPRLNHICIVSYLHPQVRQETVSACLPSLATHLPVFLCLINDPTIYPEGKHF